MVCVNKWNSGKYEIWEMGEDYVILKRENGETFKITRKEFNGSFMVFADPFIINGRSTPTNKTATKILTTTSIGVCTPIYIREKLTRTARAMQITLTHFTVDPAAILPKVPTAVWVCPLGKL